MPLGQNLRECASVLSGGEYLSDNQQRINEANELTRVDPSIPLDQFRENIRKASSILFGEK